MPKWAAPNATKVATSKLRTRMIEKFSTLVGNCNARSSFSSNPLPGTIPTRDSSGITSFRIRPRGSASTNDLLESTSGSPQLSGWSGFNRVGHRRSRSSIRQAISSAISRIVPPPEKIRSIYSASERMASRESTPVNREGSRFRLLTALTRSNRTAQLTRSNTPFGVSPRLRRFPGRTGCDEDKTVFFGDEGYLVNGHRGVLEDRRNHLQVFDVPGNESEFSGHAGAAIRSISAPQAASLASIDSYPRSRW